MLLPKNTQILGNRLPVFVLTNTILLTCFFLDGVFLVEGLTVVDVV